jgi:hypothetical protein
MQKVVRISKTIFIREDAEPRATSIRGRGFAI